MTKRLVNGTAKWVSIALVLIGVFLAWYKNDTILSEQLKANCDEDVLVHPKIQENREALIRWETKMDSFMIEQREYNREQKAINENILRELRSIPVFP